MNQEGRFISGQDQHQQQPLTYDQFKSDMHDITYRAAHMPTEFDGAMQIPDTQRVLKTKRKGGHFFDVLFDRLQQMFALRPIIGNVIALLMAGVVLYYIFHEVSLAGFGKYQAYFGWGIQLFAAIQIIKSGTRSLLLPFLAMVIGASVSQHLGGHETLLNFGRDFYQHLAIVGIIGLGVAILTID